MGAVTLLVLVTLAACAATPPPTDVVSDTDRQRAATLSHDRLLVRAAEAPVIVPGMLRSTKLGWNRTEVRARIAQLSKMSGPAVRPGAVEGELADALATMRSEGWLVYFAMCMAPPKATATGQAPPPVRIPAGIARDWAWQSIALAYRIDNGVSYYAQITTEFNDRTGDGWIDLVLRAPESHDPSNLFPDAPKPLAAKATCLDDGVDTRDVQELGSTEYMRDWYPFPSQTRSPGTAIR